MSETQPGDHVPSTPASTAGTPDVTAASPGPEAPSASAPQPPPTQPTQPTLTQPTLAQHAPTLPALPPPTPTQPSSAAPPAHQQPPPTHQQVPPAHEHVPPTHQDSAQPLPAPAAGPPSEPPPTLAAALAPAVRGVADEHVSGERYDPGERYEPPPPPPMHGGAPILAGVDYNFTPTQGNSLLHPLPIWVPFVPPPPPPDVVPEDRPFSAALRWICGTGTWGVAGRAGLILIVVIGLSVLIATGRIEGLSDDNDMGRGVATAVFGLCGLVAIIVYMVIAAALLNRRPLGRGTVTVPLPLDDIVAVVTDYALENSYRKPSLARDKWGHWNLLLEGQWGSGNPQVTMRLTPMYYGMEAFVVAMPGASWLVTVHPHAAAVTRSLLEQLRTSARLLFESREKAVGREPPPKPVEEIR